MKVLLKNCKLISMQEGREKIEDNVDILIEGNYIKNIQKKITDNEAQNINLNGKIVMPGFINTHAHVPMSLFKESVDGYLLQDWLEKKIWPVEDKLTSDDIYKYSKMTFDEMINTGTTCVNDQYFNTEDIIKAANDKKIRIELTRTLMDSDGNGKKRLDELKYILDKYSNYNPNITFNVGIHGLYTSNEKYIKEVTDFAREKKLKVHMHFCENTKEVEDIKKEYNVEYPAQVLEKYFKGIKLILAHCVKLTEEDIKILKKLDVSISHCPISNLKLGCGVAPIQKLIDNGINVTLGTDGQGSGSNMDMFETMKFTALLQKGINENPMNMMAYDVIKLATINGAKALGKENKIGSIDVNKKADLIAIDLESTCVNKPINDVFSTIVYNAKGFNVKFLMTNGEILLNSN